MSIPKIPDSLPTIQEQGPVDSQKENIPVKPVSFYKSGQTSRKSLKLRVETLHQDLGGSDKVRQRGCSDLPGTFSNTPPFSDFRDRFSNFNNDY